jgi:ribosomal protein L37AE/L43A
MAWDGEEIRIGRENDWFRQNEEQLIEAARKKREAAEKERESAQAEERRSAHWHKCPKCGSDMKVEKVGGIEIEKCSSCEGIFFDRGELEDLLLKQESQRRGFFRKLLGFGEEQS